MFTHDNGVIVASVFTPLCNRVQESGGKEFSLFK